jgi:hypothetical protein
MLVQERFTYFSDVEEHFCRRRGSHLTCSPVDWALMECWKEAGIPLEAVLRGIDGAFDKYDRRPAKTRKVNSLAYCTQEVLAAAEDMKEAAIGTTRGDKPGAALEQSELAAYLDRNAEAFEKATVPDAATALVRDDARVLRELATAVRQTPLNAEDLERRMTVMEEKLFATLHAATPDDDLVAIRVQADRELAPYRSKMSAPQIDQLMKQYTNKRLLERYKLPRLSLFYM